MSPFFHIFVCDIERGQKSVVEFFVCHPWIFLRTKAL